MNGICYANMYMTHDGNYQLGLGRSYTREQCDFNARMVETMHGWKRVYIYRCRRK